MKLEVMSGKEYSSTKSTCQPSIVLDWVKVKSRWRLARVAAASLTESTPHIMYGWHTAKSFLLRQRLALPRHLAALGRRQPVFDILSTHNLTTSTFNLDSRFLFVSSFFFSSSLLYKPTTAPASTHSIDQS